MLSTYLLQNVSSEFLIPINFGGEESGGSESKPCCRFQVGRVLALFSEEPLLVAFL